MDRINHSLDRTNFSLNQLTSTAEKFSESTNKAGENLLTNLKHLTKSVTESSKAFEEIQHS